jgi:predicted O-methyltransferase YrrM
MTTINEPDVVQRLLTDRPSFHLGGEARWDALPQTLEMIRRSARHGDSTIEVGAGASTVVFAASGACHTAISPNPAEHQRVRDYCRRIGVDESRISFVTGLSEDVLPSLLGRDRTLEVAFIDGAHSFPFPMIDWYYISRSLKVGGRLLLDDIPIPAVAQIFRHMRLEHNWRLDGVFDDRAAAFTLLAPPGPEVWAQQAFNSGYPDFSFAGLPKGPILETAYRVRQLRGRAGRRYPWLRRIYRRLV